jgi:hypothetical protein
MKRSTASLGVLLMGLFGCSARSACEETYGAGELLSSELPSESFVLESAGDSARIGVRARLTGLPELWQADSAILDGALSLKLELAYQDEPVGGDGRTEMPRVRATFGVDPRNYDAVSQTDPFPQTPAGVFGVSLFETCLDDGDRLCCEYGSRECELPLEIELERLDGAPFPPLAVDATIRATASVSSCPIEGGTPTLTLARYE